jgi:hypothetical protein
MTSALLVLALALQGPTFQERSEYVQKNVGKAIENGLKALEGLQKQGGRFEWHGRALQGSTSLALYTLMVTGVQVDDPSAARALDWLLKNPPLGRARGDWDTYEVSLFAVAVAHALPSIKAITIKGRASALLQKAVDWLCSAQLKTGGWGYSTGSDAHDHSNSQFAVMGLRAAMNSGVKVRKEVWERELSHYRTSQLTDGGWSYHGCSKDQVGSRSTSTMTAAGVMGLTMALASTQPSRSVADLAAEPAVKRGLETLRRYLTVDLTAGVPHFYWLYSLERACMVTGTSHLGEIDWYVEGAWKLIRDQDPDGLWASGGDKVVDQCFALLFLRRAYITVETPSNSGKPPAGSASAPGRPREME